MSRRSLLSACMHEKVKNNCQEHLNQSEGKAKVRLMELDQGKIILSKSILGTIMCMSQYNCVKRFKLTAWYQYRKPEPEPQP